jgi:RimJ/RimL family protein N-acetyltransferase
MISIRRLTLDDVESTFAYSSDFENTHYMLMVPHKTIDETRVFLEKCINAYESENPEYLSYAVDLDGVHIGEVFAYLSEKEADIGWLIDKRYWGNGYASQAAKLLVGYLEVKLKRTDIVAYCDARNIPSQKVMQKIGMEFVGSNGIRTYEKEVSPYEEVKYQLKRS